MKMIENEAELRDTLAELMIRGGDSTSIEVKSASSGLPESLVKTLCAFANMPDGGIIILGVNEGAGFVIEGVDNPAEIEAGIASQARTAIEPPILVETNSLNVEGKQVVVARVMGLPALEKPARFRGEAYLRMADGEYRMQPSELRMFEIAKLHANESVAYDAELVKGTSIDDLDQKLVAEFIAQVRSKNKRLSQLEDDSDILRALAVTSASGEVSLAGLYALGFYPQGRFPSLAVTVAQRLPDGSAQGRIRDLETFEGPIPVLLDLTMRWLEDHVGTLRRYRDDGGMVEVSEVPLEALREAVSNALVHRDLGPNTMEVGKAIDIRVLPEKIIIASPGGLRDLTVERLKSEDLARQEVNQRLYSLCRYLKTEDGARVIEGEGGGVQAMLHAARREGLPEPDLIDSGVQFTVKLWRPIDRHAPTRGNDPSSLSQLRNLERLGKNVPAVAEVLIQNAHPLTKKAIAEFSELSISQVRYALDALIDAGLVSMEGARGARSTRYMWLLQ